MAISPRSAAADPGRMRDIEYDPKFFRHASNCLQHDQANGR
jgi:hypothetical protein